MKNALITGASGFIGRAMVRHFLKTTDWKLILLDRLSYATDINGLMEQLRGDGADVSRITHLFHDLRAPIEGAIAERIGHVDYFVNLASESHVERSITDPGSFIRNNVDLAINALEFARKIKPEVFIQVSTDEVYGPASEGISHREWDVSIPSNPYAASKAAQEAIAISYWRTYGVPVVITNTMNNFGEDQHEEKFVPMVIRKLVDNAPITVHGTFDEKRNFISGSRVWLHAENHADAIRHILQNVSVLNYPQSDRPRRIHVSGDREVSNLEIVRIAAETLGVIPKITQTDFHSSRPGHDLRYSLDGRYLRQELGWTPPRDFDASFRDSVKAIAAS